jgi:hypothetical protein
MGGENVERNYETGEMERDLTCLGLRTHEDTN